MSVKSPEMLLKLSKNPFYVMTEGEKKRLDDFLEKDSEERLVSLANKSESKQEETTLVNVRTVSKNKVEKVTGKLEES